jgi:hypothetical protein
MWDWDLWLVGLVEDFQTGIAPQGLDDPANVFPAYSKVLADLP